MHDYKETNQASQNKAVSAIPLRRSDSYRGGAEAETNCKLNFEFTANISAGNPLMPAIREAIKGMHPDNIAGKPLHGPNDNWALTLETYGNIEPKDSNKYAFSATSELIIGGPSGLAISKLPDTVQEAYDGLKTITGTEKIDFGENFSRQIIDKIKKDRSKRTDALQTILSLKPQPSAIINPPAEYRSEWDNIINKVNPLLNPDNLKNPEQFGNISPHIPSLIQQITKQCEIIRTERNAKRSEQVTLISGSKEQYNFRTTFNHETDQLLYPWKRLENFLTNLNATLKDLLKPHSETAASNPDSLALSFPTGNSDAQEAANSLNASFSKSLSETADQPMMIQVTLGIPLNMFNAASKALAGQANSSTQPGILESRAYHSTETDSHGDIERSQLINKMKQYGLTYESNALTGLLHVINAYRRGINNTNAHDGPKHKMVLVNKNPLPDVIKSLGEPEDFNKWITLCAELIADDFIQDGDKNIVWTGASCKVSEWKYAMIHKKTDLLAVYEKAYRHGQVGGLPKLNPAGNYDPVAVYEFRNMPNLKLPELKDRFTQLAENINNFR